jgi:hypothetical protein
MSAHVSPLLILLCFSQLAAAEPTVASHIPRQPVTSKGIVSIGYSKRLHVLEIEFVNGAVYRYTQVAPSVRRELIAAESKARYYDRNIKGKYPSVRVRPRAKY